MNSPQVNAVSTTRDHCKEMFHLHLDGHNSSAADRKVAVSAMVGYVGLMMQGEAPRMTAAETPAAKGNADAAISLSTLISFLFFAKVVNIFVTLRGYA
jgi:hypothetical protein